jgi:hypothetical protein
MLEKTLEGSVQRVVEAIGSVGVAFGDVETGFNEVEPCLGSFRDTPAAHFALAAAILLRVSRLISSISRGVAFPLLKPFWISFRSS